MSRQKAYKNLTLREKYTLWLLDTLEVHGMNTVEVPAKSGKYDVFKGKDSAGDWFIFVGKSGALRFGRTAAATKSMDFSDRLKKKFAIWETHKVERDK